MIDPEDLEIKTVKGVFPGGMMVGTMSTEVWVTHLPTGICVKVKTHRSQYQNKDEAIKYLSLILKYEEETQGVWWQGQEGS